MHGYDAIRKNYNCSIPAVAVPGEGICDTKHISRFKPDILPGESHEKRSTCINFRVAPTPLPVDPPDVHGLTHAELREFWMEDSVRYCQDMKELQDEIDRLKALPVDFAQQIEVLRNKRDEDIDTSDIPEVEDWSGAVVGKFYRGPVDLEEKLRELGDYVICGECEEARCQHIMDIDSVLREAAALGRAEGLAQVADLADNFVGPAQKVCEDEKLLAFAAMVLDQFAEAIRALKEKG